MTSTEKLIEELAKSFSESLTLIQNSKKQLDKIQNEISPEIKKMSDESRSRFEMFEKKTQDILQIMEQGAAKFEHSCRTVLESIALHKKDLDNKYETSINVWAKYEKQLDAHYKSAIDSLIEHEEKLDRKYESAIQILTKHIDEFNHIVASKNEQSKANFQLDDKAINELRDLRNRLVHTNDVKPTAPAKLPNTTFENQIKPVDWAKEHGVKVDVVMKILRDAGVAVRTHMSKVDASEYAKIEKAAEEEKLKQDARNKNSQNYIIKTIVKKTAKLPH